MNTTPTGETRGHLPRSWTLERHQQPLERRIAVHQIDPLPRDANVVARPDEAMEARARIRGLRVAPVLQQLEFRAARARLTVVRRLLDRHVGDDATGARARLLRIDARARQAPHTRLQQAAVVIDQRDGVAWAFLPGFRG